MRPAQPAVVAGGRTHNVRAILAKRGFRRLLTVRALGQAADGVFQAGLAGSVLFNPERSASPAAVAIGFAILLLPYSLIGPYVGVFLDRWSRRSILSVGNVARAFLVLPVAVLIWHGSESGLFLTLALLVIGLNRLILAAHSAAVPHVVDDERLVTANAFASTVGAIAFSCGLGLAAMLVRTVLPTSFHGYAAVASIASIGYAGTAVMVWASFRPDALGPDAHVRRCEAIAAAMLHAGRGMIDGVRHLARRRRAAYALLAQSLHRALFGVLMLAMLLLYRNAFHPTQDVGGSISGLTVAVAAGGVGLLVAAFVTPPITRRIGGWRWIVGCLGLSSAALLVFVLPFNPLLLPVAVFALNVTSQGMKIVVDTALQHECDDDYRGRVFSLNDTLFNLCFVIGMYVAAMTLPDSGRTTVGLLIVAGGYALIAGGYAVVASRAERSAPASPASSRPGTPP